MTKSNEVAAALHAHLCVCPKHGYTQGEGRWGDSETCSVKVGRDTYKVAGGDRDCSSSVIDCWDKALSKTKYAGKLGWATWTGNIKEVFTASGLFVWHPMRDGYIAQTGDLYLRHNYATGKGHVAMCQSAVPDMLSEFVSNEYGGIVGGQKGDQTGGESRIVPYYDNGWNGILEYNHKADSKDLPTTLEKYSDLDPDAWYIPYVQKMVEGGIMSGNGENWQPSKAMSRAAAVTAISRKLGWGKPDSLPFEDIGTWYTAPTMAAAERGVVDVSGGKFHPDRACTREELATFVWRAFGRPEAEPFEGASSWAEEAVGWCIEKGIISAAPRPKSELTRAEAAAMMSRF